METIVQTLPISQVRQVAYATFSILQVFHSGDAYLVEFDNPSCIFIRNGKLIPIPENIREVEGKKINEYRFQVQKGDALILMSDGTVHAGVGQLVNFGWLWEDIAAYAVKQYGLTVSAVGWLLQSARHVMSCISTGLVMAKPTAACMPSYQCKTGSPDDRPCKGSCSDE